jgi:outer membrane protein insertion porin family
LFAGTAADVPFSERYFLGGSTSLRGWGRFQVSPLTEEGLPIGGRALLDTSTELRFTFGQFGAVAFVDAGQVWADSAGLGSSPLLLAAGPGLRWVSPIGIVRADVGFQLRRIPGLLVNGEPETRRWRIHFSIGQAF